MWTDIVRRAFTILRVATAHNLTGYARSYLLTTCVWSLTWHTALYYPPLAGVEVQWRQLTSASYLYLFVGNIRR